ncbi:MAG: hypothetical protein ABIQ99_09300 [Thermoflexales bacterium]
MFAKVRAWANAHPRLAAWIGLSIGMVIILVIASNGAGLQFGNLVFLVAATVVVAGLCVWIIGWEDGDDAEDPAPAPKPKKS